MMSGWLEPLGPLASPFGVCSVLVLLLILERLLFFASLGRLMVHRLLLLLTAARTGQWTALIDQCRARRGLPAAGLRLLLEHRSQPRGLREEILGRWLGEQRCRLHAHARWLLLLAVVSLLLGLLGTALGMIGAFRDLGTHAGPVVSRRACRQFAADPADHGGEPHRRRARTGGRLPRIARKAPPL